MPSEVTLPFWIVALAALFAAIGLIDRLLLPSMRWALRRRANKAIDELNTRLRLHIQPFKLTKRQVLIDRLVYDPVVLDAIASHAQETGVPHDVALDKAKRYAREIVPAFNAYAYFRVGTRAARRLSEALYRVRLGYRNDEALKAVDPDAAVVFVINHRSNMDYVLVTYVAASSSALSYAVGEWAQIWGLSGLIRSMGAYFIRRDNSNALYRRILARYVQMATQAGVVQAVFPEGGLTRDGQLRPAKLGLLSYMVSGFDPAGPRDIVFIPVGLNYDRVLEDRMQLAAGAREDGGAKASFRFSPLALIRFLGHSLWLRLTGRWHRFGYACVSFGEPLSLRQHLAWRAVDLRTASHEQKAAEIDRLGNLLMQRIGDVVPALPVALVATVLIEAAGEPRTRFEIKGRVFDLIRVLEAAGAYVHIPRNDRDYALDVGLRMLALRHIAIEGPEPDTFRANPQEEALLAYYANSIAHLWARQSQPAPATSPVAASVEPPAA